MDGFDLVEARKVFCVEGQDALHAMDAHGRNESCIMHLNSGDAIVNQQPPPFLVDSRLSGADGTRLQLLCSNICFFWR